MCQKYLYTDTSSSTYRRKRGHMFFLEHNAALELVFIHRGSRNLKRVPLLVRDSGYWVVRNTCTSIDLWFKYKYKYFSRKYKSCSPSTQVYVQAHVLQSQLKSTNSPPSDVFITDQCVTVYNQIKIKNQMTTEIINFAMSSSH